MKSDCSLNQNFALSLQTNNINLVNNVAGVSASDDDLQIFGGSTGNAASLLAVTLSLGSWLMVQGSRLMVQG